MKEQTKSKTSAMKHTDLATVIIHEEEGTLEVRMSKKLAKKMAALAERTAGIIPAS